MASSENVRIFVRRALPFAAVVFLTTQSYAQTRPSTGGTGGPTTGGAGTNMGSAGAGTSTGTGTGVSGLQTADQLFSDGIQRSGTAEVRGLDSTTDPGAAGSSSSNRGGGVGGLGGLGGMGGLGGLGGLSQLFGGMGQSQQQQRSVRTRLSSGIQVTPLAASSVGNSVNSRLASMPTTSRFTGINVQMDGRTAILTGLVSSESDKRMARLLVRLEPGVSKIEDRIEVKD